MMNKIERMSGTVKKMLYEKKLGLMDVVLDDGKQVTATWEVTDTTPRYSAGDKVEGNGFWIVNSTYGTQFSINEHL